jgi:hypothetical protein
MHLDERDLRARAYWPVGVEERRPQIDEDKASMERTGVTDASTFNDPAELDLEIGPPTIFEIVRTRAAAKARRRRVAVVSAVVAASMAILLVALVGWNGAWGSGVGICAPWDRVDLQVSSSPSGATIYVDGDQVGTTPATVRALCRGKQGHVLLQAPGHVSWEWRGLVPEVADLQIQAKMLRR